MERPTTPETLDHLVEEHLYLVQHVVNQLAARYPRHVDRQELWNAGALGLVDAARRYDPDTGIPFPRYATIRIRGTAIDSTRSRDWSTRGLRRGIRDLRRAGERLAVVLGRDATTEELAEALGVSTAQIQAYRTAAAASCLLHLDQPVRHGDAEDATLGDLIEERSWHHLPQDHLERREMLGTLRVALCNLPPVQREVMQRYYFGEEYLREIAESLGVTEARVSQIRAEALNALRAYFRAASFDGVPPITEDAPGRRSRAAFVAAVAERSTWRSRLEAASASTLEEVAASA